VRQEDLVQADLKESFTRAYACGIELRRQQALATFMTCMQQFQQSEDVAAWVALVGLCQGLFVDDYGEAEAAQAFTMLSDFLPA
jgi:hypothetical protein